MSSNILPTMRQWHERAHRDILELTADLSDQQLTWNSGDGELPVIWHLWHISRFADITQSIFCDEDEIWHSKAVAKEWGFTPEKLGAFEAGTGMDQDYATSIEWPERKTVVNYAESAIEASIQSTARVTESNFDTHVPRIDSYPGAVLTYGNILTRFIWHPGRHLGDIETLVSRQAKAAVAS